MTISPLLDVTELKVNHYYVDITTGEVILIRNVGKWGINTRRMGSKTIIGMSYKFIWGKIFKEYNP